jgi:hypothetical protein
MMGNAGLFALLCITAIGCAAPIDSEVAGPRLAS